jgi:hypothetical protein
VEAVVRVESAFQRGLHLFALCSFALVQPLLDLLGREPGFLVAHGAGALDISLLLLALTLCAPAGLWLVEELAGRASPRLGDALHGLWIALLAALVASPLVKKLPWLAAPLDLVVVLLLGGVAAAAYFGLAWVRSFVGVLALAPLVFAGLFLSREGVSALVFGSAGGIIERPVVEVEIPVVMLVFDELSLTSLLDERGEIDPIRYPSFARLAGESHWLRNASAVDWRTLQVIPSLLTGLYPEGRRRLPIAQVHPRSLFSLLDGHYRMNVKETHTRLHGSGADHLEPLAGRMSTLFHDLSLVYLHVILPARYSDGLPPVIHTWKDFGGKDHATDGHAGPGGGTRDRGVIFRAFVASIDAKEPASLHFLHIMLPHSPWEYTPEGTRYSPHKFHGSFLGKWLDEQWWVVDAWQRHLLQLEFVDRLLGELVAHLERIGLYDECLLVVTADHGVSFWPGETYRDFAGTEHPEDILSVPLFIKEPGQRLGTRRLDNVESVDVFPSIADLLEIELDWEMDGCSIFDASCPERPDKVAFTTEEFQSDRNRTLRFASEIVQRQESLRRKLALFGSGRTAPDGLQRFGAGAALVGRRVSELLEPGPPAGSVTLDRGDGDGIRGAEPLLRVFGTLSLEAQPHATGQAAAEAEGSLVAVALGGVVRRVVPALTDGRNPLRVMAGRSVEPDLWVSALLSEEAVRVGSGLELYLVGGSAEVPTLRPLTLR